MQCSRCGLINSNLATICQCGEPLRTSASLPYQSQNDKVANLTEEEKNWAVGVHVCELAAMFFPMANVIGPIVIYMLKRKESAFVASHARTSINFQLTAFLVAIMAILSIWVGFISIKDENYFMMAPAVIFGILFVVMAIGSLVFSIVGLIRAREGRIYRYPLSIPFLGRN